MSERFSLLYRFSTDYGLTWVDLTPQVDSRQTVITQNLCTNNFTSAKDEATFVMPETPLYDADGNATPKKLLMDALMGDDDILVEINAPGPVDVLWKGEDVLWKGFHVQWRGSVRHFTGYADRSSMNLRSYPLPPRLTVKVQDVSVLHLDDKVNDDILLENKRISEIVAALLAHAGYVSVGSTALDNTDDETLEAFVIDKDGSRTYRQYIDDLLFEAGGYVLDFNESGQANVVHLQWDGSASVSRTIDNPMNADGVTLRSAWLKEDGVKVRWSSLAWAANTRIWQADISQDSEGGVLTGQKVQAGHYWPENGELDPVYMEYDAKLLDSDYLTRASRRENKDLTVIMAKNMSARIDAMQGNTKFTAWTRPDPATWPQGDNWKDKYGIPSNPAYWPTKAWHLLYNGSGSDVTLTFFSIYGDVLYRSKVNTVEMAGSQNPKEYESTYIYNQAHAERFVQFWWHFLQTSRYQFTWSEPNRRSALNDVVSVGVKGNGSTQKALIAGKTSKWINDNVEVISYTAVGIDTYSPASLVPVSILPSTSVPAASVPKGPVEAKFPTTPSHTLAEWESSYSGSSIWTVTNASDFSVGDIALIRGVISDMGDNPVNLYISVSAVSGTAITGTGVNLVYTPMTWDFEMSQSSVARNDRLTGSYTDITLTAITPGYTIIPAWAATAGTLLSATGMEVILRVPADVSAESITVIMSDGNMTSVSKEITVVNQTEYDHDFGAWEPTGIYDLPDHYTVDGVDYDVIPGDFFVAKTTFTVGGDTYTEGVPYKYSGNAWHNPITATTTDDTGRLLHCLGNVLGSSAVQPSTAALYGWFQNLVAKNAVIGNLVAQTAFIEQLNATAALFNSIHITGNSQFDGEISNDAFETYGASSAVTYSGSFSTSIQTGTLKPSSTSSWGDTCKAYCVPTSELVSVFGGSVLDRVACTGTMVIDGVTYTGTADNPIYVSVTEINMAGHRKWSLKQGTYNISWAEYVNFWDFPSGYSSCVGAEVSSSSTPKKGNLTSVTLTSIVSLGGAFTHDMLPKSHLVDTIGTDNNRYKDIYTGTSSFPSARSVAITNIQGYCRLTNGLILQWGSAATSYSSGYRHRVTLTVPFPNTLEFYLAIPVDGCYLPEMMQWTALGLGTLGLGKMYDRSGNEVTESKRVFFIALGT